MEIHIEKVGLIRLNPNPKNKQLTLDTATGEDMTYSIVTNSVNNKKLSTLILGNSDFETLINTKNNMFKV